MMGKKNKNGDKDLGAALTQFVTSLVRGYTVFEGTVEEVDQEKFVATVKVGDSIFSGVFLKVLKGSQASFVEIPKVGSVVLLCFRDGNINRPQIISVDEVETILIDAPTVVFNGGELGGMVKAKELKSQSEKDKAVLDSLLSILKGPPISEPGNGAPSALQAALKLAIGTKTSGSWNDLENPKITQ